MRENRTLRLTWRGLETWPWWNCEPTLQSKEREWKPSTYRRRACPRPYRGGAVGKGLGYSTSLAAYSTLAGRASISCAAASCWPRATGERVSHTRRSSRTPTPRQWRHSRGPRPRRWTWDGTSARLMEVRRSSWLWCGTCRAGREVEACPCERRSGYSRACLLGIEVRDIPGLSRHHQKGA